MYTVSDIAAMQTDTDALQYRSVPSTPPPASSVAVASTVAPVAAAVNASGTAAAPAPKASNTIIETNYLLVSFLHSFKPLAIRETRA